MIIALSLIALALVILGCHRYKTWRDRRDLIASPSDLWRHMAAYEPSAKERRQ